MIIVRKTSDVEIELPDIISGGMTGEFKLEAFKGVEFPKGSGNVFEFSGTRRLLQDWHPNLILDQGLDYFGAITQQLDSLDKCHVGTGSTPPVNSNTQLEIWVASASEGGSGGSFTAQSTPPYYGMETRTYLFYPGFAGGGDINLNEIAVGTTHTPTSITARSLTVNEAGDPASVAVLESEYLECYYRRRNYPGHIDEATGNPTDDQAVVNIQGVDYTYTIRPAMVTVGGSYSTGTSDGWGTFAAQCLSTANGYSYNVGSTGQAGTFDCTLGAVTGTLSDFQSIHNSTSNSGYGDSYSAGSYTKELWWQWSINQANDDGGIGGLFLKTSLGAYQMVFDTPIPKVYGQIFTFFHNFSWNRKNSWI